VIRVDTVWLAVAPLDMLREMSLDLS